MFEFAKWIAPEQEPDQGVGPLLRKAFIIDGEVACAKLHAVGLGYGDFFINGTPVTTDVLTTPNTSYDTTVLYNSYDVTSLLNKGDNCLCAALGNGMYNPAIGKTWEFDTARWRNHPKMLAQLDVRYADGRECSVLSDSSWSCFVQGPTVYNEFRGGEKYDARLNPKGWQQAGFDASGWQKTMVCRSPGGILKPNIYPKTKIVRALAPAGKTAENVYDFGENISGWVRITVRGKAGDQVKITYSELIFENGGIDNEHINMFNEGEQKHVDIYILSGEGEESWNPSFCYHGFRYAEITTEAQIIAVEAQVVHTHLPFVGEFECGDNMLNQIHIATRRATLANFVNIPTDCPHREQNGWTGDALLSCEQALMNYEIKEAYRKWLLDFKDAQRPSGQLPGIVPTPGWGYNWGSGPAWDSSIILMPYYIYQNTGDYSIICDMFENMERYMGFMNSMAQDYLLDFGLGDWCAPEKTDKCPAGVTDTAYYYVNAKTMARCAKLLGRGGEGYKQLARNIKKAFRGAYLKDGIIANGGQTAMACGIYQGLYNAEEIPNAAKKLASLVKENGMLIDCGILGTKYIFSALSENGYADIAYKMVVNPSYPSYAHWMLNGDTTLAECWELGKASRNHHMFSEVDMWMYKHLAGIKIDQCGLTVNPCIIPEIGFVKAKHRNISVEWDLKTLKINAPVDFTLVLNGAEKQLAAGQHEISL